MTADHEQFAGNTTLRASVEAVFRHRGLFTAIVATALAATALVIVFTPRTYRSEMNILVRNARPDYLLSPERSTGQLVTQDVTEERINSEIEVLRSKDIADAVIDPAWSSGQHSDAEVRAHEKAVVKFGKDLSIELLRKSNVIHVGYVTTSPRAATDTVERLLAAFLAKQREIERSTGASSFFAGEAARYKAELDQAQQQLAGYQQSNQIVSLPNKESTLELEINTLEDGIRSTQVQLTEATDRVASDKHQLALLPQRLATAQRSIPNTQAVEQLTAILVNYQNKRTELLERYQPTDRLVTELNQQIATTSAALATARATNGEESTTDINPVYQQVKSALTASTTDLASLRGRLADLSAQRDRLRQQLTSVEGSTVDYTTLETRVAELKNNYQLYTQKKNEAEIADAMDQQQLVNVAVAERPTFTAKPYRPQILLNLALGSFTALFFAGCAIFFAELGRDTFAAPYELEAVSGAPILATVPFLVESFTAYTRETPPQTPLPRRKLEPDFGPLPNPVPPYSDVPSGGVPAFAGVAETERVQASESTRTFERIQEIYMSEPTREPSPEPVKRLARTELRTYEQLAASGAVATEPAATAPVATAQAPVATAHVPLMERVILPVVEAPARVAPAPEAHASQAIFIRPRTAATAESAQRSSDTPAPPPDTTRPPLSDPASRLSNHFRAKESAIPTRSRLTPSQRREAHRSTASGDRPARLAYVTYTVDSGD